MGDRIEANKDPFWMLRPPEDDGGSDPTKTCGDTMSRGQPADEPQVDQHLAKPSELAAVAKNMADAALRADYEKMSDTQLEAATRELTKRLSTTSYGGAVEDAARLAVAESVVRARNERHEVDPKTSAAMTAAKQSADEKQQEADGWRVPEIKRQEHGYGVETSAAASRGEHVTWFEGSAKVGSAHTGFSATAVQVHDVGGHVGPVAAEGEGRGASVGWDTGMYNRDGSIGLHNGGGVDVVSGEGTVHVKHVGSFTYGGGVGISGELSVGVKKDGDTIELCARGGIDVVYGYCVPLGRI